MAKVHQDEKVARQREFALTLRKDGHSYRAIGVMLATQFANQQRRTEFTATYARKLVHQAIKEIYKEEANDLIRIESERLDDLTLQALDVLRTEHVTISNGEVVSVPLLNANGQPVIDAATGHAVRTPIRDDGPRLAAIDRLLRIQDRRAKLLGLDKPVKIAPTNPAGDKAATTPVFVASAEDLKL